MLPVGKRDSPLYSQQSAAPHVCVQSVPVCARMCSCVCVCVTISAHIQLDIQITSNRICLRVQVKPARSHSALKANDLDELFDA